MRKISKSRSASDSRYAFHHSDEDEPPRRIPGATITAWHGSPEIDLEALLVNPFAGPTITDATADHGGKETVALSDGTEITFTAPDQFGRVLTAR